MSLHKIDRSEGEAVSLLSALAVSIVVGFSYWYLENVQHWERERLRLWRAGFPWSAMPNEPDENRRLGLTTIEMRCRMVRWEYERLGD